MSLEPTIEAVRLAQSSNVWSSARWVDGRIEVREGQPICDKHRFVALSGRSVRGRPMARCVLCGERRAFKPLAALAALALALASCVGNYELEQPGVCERFPDRHVLTARELEHFPPPQCEVLPDDESQGVAWRSHLACAFNARGEAVTVSDPSAVARFGCDGLFWRNADGR